MLKQKKNLNIKKANFFKNWSKKKIIQNKTKLRARKIFKNKPYVINPSFQHFVTNKEINRFYKKISIRITPNNVFCTLKNINKNKTIKIGSSGKYKVKTSKKTLRYSTKVVVESFLEEIKSELSSKRIIINLIAPIRIRKTVLKQLSKYTRKNSIIINVDNKKCFNGCRPPKKRRKKQKGLRVFK
jgi:ribosomal protein S11